MTILNDIKWQQLEKVNELKFINTMYIWIFLVPIITRIFEKVEGSATITVFNFTFEMQLTLPFSWVIFYFSAISFAMANLIYQLRCPNIIKDHKDYADFRSSNKGVEHLDPYLFQVGMNWEGLRQELESQEEYFDEIHQVSNPKTDDGLLRKRFWTIYRRGNEVRKIAKSIALFLYIIGFILISIVFSQNIIFVIKYICN